MRRDKLNYYLDIAETVLARGTCLRRNFGAIIVKKDQIISGSDQSTTGCIIYRGVEAYLNYLEAYYLRNGKVDGKAAQYWTAIRKRGGVDTDYEKTIRNTDMSKEVDWAKYSGSTLQLYSISVANVVANSSARVCVGTT